MRSLQRITQTKCAFVLAFEELEVLSTAATGNRGSAPATIGTTAASVLAAPGLGFEPKEGAGMVSRLLVPHAPFAPGMLQRWLLSTRWDVHFSCRHAPRLHLSGMQKDGGTGLGTAGDPLQVRASTCRVEGANCSHGNSCGKCRVLLHLLLHQARGAPK